MSGPGRAFDKCPGRAGRPGSLGVAGRGSLISPGVAGRGARVGDPPRPCQPWRSDPCPAAVNVNTSTVRSGPGTVTGPGRRLTARSSTAAFKFE